MKVTKHPKKNILNDRTKKIGTVVDSDVSRMMQL